MAGRQSTVVALHRRSGFWSVTAALCAAVTGVCSAAVHAQAGTAARIVVGFKEGVPRSQRAAVLARDGAALTFDIGKLSADEATVPAGSRDAILARLRAEPSRTRRSTGRLSWSAR